MDFIMLVGIPGCGKSTYSKKLAEKGYIIHSSDAIREELNMHDMKDTSKVFDIMHKRVISDLQNGKNVIYDATNLSRKNRIHFLNMIQKFDCQKICKLFIIPINICKERNAKRTGYARVPEYVYDNMLRSFTVPMLSEGFDKIDLIYGTTGSVDDDVYPNIEDYMMNLDQNNPHHTHTVGEHQNLAVEYLKNTYHYTDDNVVVIAAKYHDIGKVFTKSFTDMKGNPTEYAHFYGHDNYGAYVFLLYASYLENVDMKDSLRIAQLINWHMAPLRRWNISEKTKNKDICLFDNLFISQLEELHDADMNAH